MERLHPGDSSFLKFPLVSSMARMALSGTRAMVRWRRQRPPCWVSREEAAELGPKMHLQLDFWHPPGETFANEEARDGAPREGMMASEDSSK